MKFSRNLNACSSSLARSGANSFPRLHLLLCRLRSTCRIYLISSSHSYHNSKIPLRHEHLMTNYDTLRRRLLIPIIISSRASTSHIVFAPTLLFLIRIPNFLRPSRARVIVARPRFLPLPLRLLHPIKSFISSSYFFFILGPVRSHFVYHVLPDLSLMCYLYQYLVRYPGFSRYSLLVSGLLRHFLLFHEVVFVTSVGNNAIPLLEGVLSI